MNVDYKVTENKTNEEECCFKLRVLHTNGWNIE